MAIQSTAAPGSSLEPIALEHLSQKAVEDVIQLANANDQDREVNQRSGLDPVRLLSGSASYQRLRNWIDELSEAQTQELCALMWLGRENDPASEFPYHLQMASGLNADYIASKNNLGDYLSSGLEALGYDPDEQGVGVV